MAKEEQEKKNGGMPFVYNFHQQYEPSHRMAEGSLHNTGCDETNGDRLDAKRRK